VHPKRDGKDAFADDEDFALSFRESKLLSIPD
jgi:hypothetical protein